MFWNLKIWIWKGLSYFHFFPSKAYVLDHSETIDMHIEKWYEKINKKSMSAKTVYAVRGGGG